MSQSGVKALKIVSLYDVGYVVMQKSVDLAKIWGHTTFVYFFMDCVPTFVLVVAKELYT